VADGSREFNFPPPQLSRLRPGEIVVDLFAGGGGASEALKQALGIDPALAYNHDEWAIGMHAANHPLTIHHREDIWHADPRRDVAGRPVGWFHASPDCTHFSQAKGGQPRSRKTRALSWVVLKWVGQLAKVGNAPRIVSLENVWQILTWGPLVAKRDRGTGRVLKMDGSVAAVGERVPVENQQLVPNRKRSGRTWRQFVAALRACGYQVEWQKLVASDYGAGTSRERLFMLARRDGEPIRWPEPTHGNAPGLQPRVSAADCLDFSLPCPSIFARKRPLADATLRRIAKGVMRHVIDAADPFIVPGAYSSVSVRCDSGDDRGTIWPFLTEHANASTSRTWSPGEPLRTQCAGVKGGHFALVAPVLAGVGGRAGQTEPRQGDEPLYTITTKADTALIAPVLVQSGYGEAAGQAPRALDLQKPLGTIVAGGVKHAVAAPVMIQAAHGDGKPGGVQRWGSGNKPVGDPVGMITASGTGGHAVACAFLEQANGGFYEGGGRDARAPMSTITAAGSQQQLVTAHLVTNTSGHPGAAATHCVPTITAAGNQALVECTLRPEQEAGALQVAAFLMRYYGEGGQWGDLRRALPTVTTKDRMALVTVLVRGTPYVIVDIGLRMLKPHELYRAQGFPAGYIIERTADGRPISTTAAVRMVGNSVSPPPLRALALANLDPVSAPAAVAA
jgi:DNA (cytosine-5)-methyltransferase 1